MAGSQRTSPKYHFFSTIVSTVVEKVVVTEGPLVFLVGDKTK